MQNIIWGILILSFIIDIIRRSYLNNEKTNIIKDNNLNNKDVNFDNKLINDGISFFFKNLLLVNLYNFNQY